MRIWIPEFLDIQMPQSCPAREGVIIEYPLNGQYHDARDIILMSRTGIREMVDDDDDDEWPLVISNLLD